MRAGTLNQRITIQALVNTPDAYGGNIETWVDVGTVWAKIEQAIANRGSGRAEFWSSQQINISLAYVVTIRYHEGITPVNRVLFGARVFKIHAVVNPNEGREMLQLMCEEVISANA